MSAYVTNTYVYGFQMINRMADLEYSSACFSLLPTNGCRRKNNTKTRNKNTIIVRVCVCVCIFRQRQCLGKKHILQKK